MTVTAIPVQTLAAAGSVVTYAAANSGGSTIPATRDIVLEVVNGDSGSHNVTITSHAPVSPGLAVADLVVAVAAGVTKRIPITNPAPYRDPADNLIHIAFSAVTSTTVAAVTLH